MTKGTSCKRCESFAHKDARSSECPYNIHYSGPANFINFTIIVIFRIMIKAHTRFSQCFQSGGNRNSSIRAPTVQSRGLAICNQRLHIDRKGTSSRHYSSSFSCLPPAPPPSPNLNPIKYEECPNECFVRHKKKINFPPCKECQDIRKKYIFSAVHIKVTDYSATIIYAGGIGTNTF
ncbi:hypothetical protein K501DRAFT_278337 [Backusella circina FSU 941]|nr:hypothetical protein K501DRAFT_278337 [Backusella circina FSU 941]